MDIERPLHEDLQNKPSVPVLDAPLAAACGLWLALVAVAGMTILVDQFSKWLIVRSLDYGETWTPVPALGGFFDLTYTRNTGAAFGLAQDFGNVFLIIAVVVVGAMLYYYRHLPKGSLLVRFALGLQMGGALGNAVDRIHRGYVVDFFHFHFWPIFNVADSAIVVGVALLAAILWWQDRRQPKEAAADE